MAGLIVHEWIEKTGGAEKVLEQFVSLYPDADLHVLWNDDAESFPHAQESWLASTPLRNQKALALPLLPLTWRNLRIGSHPEWILVSSHLFAHHVARPRAARKVPKFTYVHTPARYIWAPELDRRGASAAARATAHLFKPIDRRRAQESEHMVANSEFTRERLRHAWKRDADVIYPPVDVERILNGGVWREALKKADQEILGSLPESFLLGASRFVPYKRLDAVIDAGEAMDLPVVLAGRGPGRSALAARAELSSVPVHFVDSPSDALLFSLYQACLAYIFPAVEDFGIMPVEAIAAGARVVVPADGGAAETVRATGGGSVISRFERNEWRSAIDTALRVSSEAAGTTIELFGTQRFREQISNWIARGAA